MKLNCGLRAWEAWLARRARISVWHRWFAWRPVRVDDYDCRWLEVVERRADCYQYIKGVRGWLYRALSEEPQHG